MEESLSEEDGRRRAFEERVKDLNTEDPGNQGN